MQNLGSWRPGSPDFLPSSLSFGYAWQDRVDLGRVARHVGGPGTEHAMPVYHPNPFGQELPRCLLLLVILAFDFQNRAFAAR